MIKYKGWVSINTCIDFSAWVFWSHNRSYTGRTFIRILGFEFSVTKF